MAAADSSALRAALFTTAIAAVGAALISISFEVSRERIAENQRVRLQAQLAEVLGGLHSGDDLTATRRTVVAPAQLGSSAPQDVYTTGTADDVEAVVISAIAPHGYNGPIALLIGIDSHGRITGVRVTDHRETPGLGDAIEIARSRWIDGFTGTSLTDPPISDWRLRKDGGRFDAITGATVTPRAVTEAVKNALLYFRDNRDWLLDINADGPPSDAR